MTSTLLAADRSVTPYLAAEDRAATIAFAVAAVITLTGFIIGMITRT